MNFSKIERPVSRFMSSGFSKMGAVERAKDTRTVAQLSSALDYYGQKTPEIEKYIPEIKKSKHLSLAVDIAEHAHSREMLPTSIDLKQKNENGISPFEAIFSMFAQTSKKHPATLDLMQEVLNQTDSIASKYTLLHLPHLMKNPIDEHKLQAAIPMIKTAAESTLEGGYTMDYSKQKDFVGFLEMLTGESAKPEKVKALPEILKISDDISKQNEEKTMIIDPYMLVTNPRPVNEVLENLKTLQTSGLYSKMDSKTPFDVADFANKNVNLVG